MNNDPIFDLIETEVEIPIDDYFKKWKELHLTDVAEWCNNQKDDFTDVLSFFTEHYRLERMMASLKELEIIDESI